MTEMGSSGTFDNLLASHRRRRFVVRASEIELLRAALDSPEPPCSMLHLHQPGGMGQTRSLDGFSGLAAATGASMTDDLYGTSRQANAVDLLGTVESL